MAEGEYYGIFNHIFNYSYRVDLHPGEQRPIMNDEGTTLEELLR